mgnify:CR=1 FL=1
MAAWSMPSVIRVRVWMDRMDRPIASRTRSPVPSLITDIRKRVFTEIARMAYEGGDYTRAEDLPYVIVPLTKDMASLGHTFWQEAARQFWQN